MKNHLSINMTFWTKAMAAIAVCLLIAGAANAQYFVKPESTKAEAEIQNRTAQAFVFPNTSSEIFTLKTDKDAEIAVYNHLMNPVQPRIETLLKGERRIDMTNFDDGPYFIHVRTRTGQSTVQIFKR